MKNLLFFITASLVCSVTWAGAQDVSLATLIEKYATPIIENNQAKYRITDVSCADRGCSFLDENDGENLSGDEKIYMAVSIADTEKLMEILFSAGARVTSDSDNNPTFQAEEINCTVPTNGQDIKNSKLALKLQEAKCTIK